MSDKKNPTGAVQINDPVFNEVREYCKARGMHLSFFFAKAGINLMNELDKNPDFIKDIQERPVAEKTAS